MCAGELDENTMLSRFHQLAVASKKAAHERVCAVVFALAPFSEEDGTLNGTGKLVRRALYELYRHTLQDRFKTLQIHTPLAHFEQETSFKEQGGTSLQAAQIAGLCACSSGLPLERVVALNFTPQTKP